MSVLKPFDLYVSYVEKEGQLLKLWCQLNRSSVELVERLISKFSPDFDKGFAIPHESTLSIGQVCCARYHDGVYYRARITSLSDLMKTQVSVLFIDYGNSEVVFVDDIRVLDSGVVQPLDSLPGQATEFYLAGVIPAIGDWNDESLQIIRQTICYAELQGVVLSQCGNKKLLNLLYQNQDFSRILIDSNIAAPIALQAQQAIIQALFTTPSFPSFNVPPPALSSTNRNIPSIRVTGQNVFPEVRSVLPPPNYRTVNPTNFPPPVRMNNPVPLPQHSGKSIFSSPLLDINSQHNVYVSHIEDGPSSFTVQLELNSSTLGSLMEKINSFTPCPFSQPLMPGTVCLGRFTEDKTLCRAVVMAVLGDRCKLYYVDFGNSEILPYSEIYNIPEEFVAPKVMALRFTLFALKDLGKITNDVKTMFNDIVSEKLVQLRVTPADGPPLKQYCELYTNGQNVKEMLLQSIKSIRQVESYDKLPLPIVGGHELALISFIKNPSDFYIQYEGNTDALNNVMTTLETHCETAPILQPKLFRVGMPCCALYSEDNQWYRAQILSIAPHAVNVHYIDYGNTDSVQYSMLKEISPSLVEILGAQAVRCCLKGFQSNHRDELTGMFEEMTLGKSLKMVVTGTGYMESETLVVELYDESISPPANIGSKLLIPDTIPTAQENENIQEAHPNVEGK
ncbi:unnamed protein product [Timema podura]|uniref:Tudor domain-containing protein n=1 Tax=Timema podura TaxID=61482 RepID=A0ABN7P2R8_TIMPD|nr:unnamed protein product [Timema podura]